MRGLRLLALTGIVAALAASQGAVGQSPSPATTSQVDRLSLEALCQQNAVEVGDLENCLEVVRRFLAPEEARPSTPPVASDSVTVKGSGDKSSKAFELAGGDYVVTLTTRDIDRDGFGIGCTARGSLKLTEDNSEAATVQGAASARRNGKTTSYLYGIPPGRHYWDFSLTSCERWEVNLRSFQHTYGPEPELGVVVRKGKDTFDTEPFVLSGGDYTAEVSLKAGAGECRLTAYLIPVAEYNLFGNVGDVSAEAPKRRTINDETQLYAVPADRYYWSVSNLSFAVGLATCEWSLTLRQQE